MHPQHANTDFSRVKQNDFSGAARLTATQLDENSSIFPDPPVDPPTLNGQIDQWDEVLGKPTYDGQTGDLIKARAIIETSVSENGKYVNGLAKGDLSMLQKSGYPISKLHAPVGDLLPPDLVKVSSGTAPGSFDFNIAVVESAKGYLIAYTSVSNLSTDPNQWTIRWSAKHNNTLTGFASGTQYKFAACAVGSTNNVYWTNSHNNLFAQ